MKKAYTFCLGITTTLLVSLSPLTDANSQGIDFCSGDAVDGIFISGTNGKSRVLVFELNSDVANFETRSIAAGLALNTDLFARKWPEILIRYVGNRARNPSKVVMSGCAPAWPGRDTIPVFFVPPGCESYWSLMKGELAKVVRDPVTRRPGIAITSEAYALAGNSSEVGVSSLRFWNWLTLHEILHLLGFEHDNCLDCIMRPTFHKSVLERSLELQIEMNYRPRWLKKNIPTPFGSSEAGE